MNDGEADLAIVQTTLWTMRIMEPTCSRKRARQRNLPQSPVVYAEVCQVVSTGDIKSIADLKGKRVSVGDDRFRR